MEEQRFKEQFFSQIYDQYIEKIYRFVLFKVDSEVFAQDITSESFSRLWGQIQNKKDIKNPAAFLYTTSRNLLIDHYRRKEKEKGSISLEKLDFKLDSGKDMEEEISQRDDLDRVKVALTCLKDDYRQAVSLYYIEQEPITEVARSLGKSEGATRVLIHRGIKKLKNHLEA